MFGGLLLGLLLFGGHKECHCKTCLKEKKADDKWWADYYKKHPLGCSTSMSGSTSSSCSVGMSPSVII